MPTVTPAPINRPPASFTPPGITSASRSDSAAGIEATVNLRALLPQAASTRGAVSVAAERCYRAVVVALREGRRFVVGFALGNLVPAAAFTLAGVALPVRY